MTYRDYFDKHQDENLSWCKPYVDKTGDYFLLMYEGECECVVTPHGTFCRYNGTLTDDIMEEFAKAVNNGYYCYHGWTDEHIALDVMTEVGCAACPLNSQCDPMFEEYEEATL